MGLKILFECIGVRHHGAKLPDTEGIALDAAALLAIKDAAWVVDLDGDRNRDKQQRCHREANGPAYNVYQSLKLAVHRRMNRINLSIRGRRDRWGRWHKRGSGEATGSRRFNRGDRSTESIGENVGRELGMASNHR